MPFDFEDFRAMYLGGTVALPSPYPAVGYVEGEDVPRPRAPDEEGPTRRRRNAAEEPTRRGAAERIQLLILRHRLDPRKSVTRIVPADLVAAVFLPEDPTGDIDPNRGRWRLKPVTIDIIKGAASGMEKQKGLAMPGVILFVPEQSYVLTRWEAGQSAAESAEAWWPRTCCPKHLYTCCPKPGGHGPLLETCCP